MIRMTSKRFYRNRGTIWENDKSMSLGEVEDKLNALYEENEQLQIEKNTLKKQHTYELTKKLEYKSKLTDLKKENKQLKSLL